MKLQICALLLYISYTHPFGIALDQTIPYCVDFYGACVTPYPLIIIGMRPELSSIARVHRTALTHWMSILNYQKNSTHYIIEAGLIDYLYPQIPISTRHICGIPSPEDHLRTTIFYRMINYIAAYPQQIQAPKDLGPDLLLTAELREKTGARTLTELIYQTYTETHSLKSIITLQYLLDEPCITRTREEIYQKMRAQEHATTPHAVVCIIKSLHVPLLLQQLIPLKYNFFYTSRMVQNRDYTPLDGISLTTLLMSSFLAPDRIREQSYLLESCLQEFSCKST